MSLLLFKSNNHAVDMVCRPKVGCMSEAGLSKFETLEGGPPSQAEGGPIGGRASASENRCLWPWWEFNEA